MKNNPDFTFQDFEAFGSIELSPYTRVYIEMFLKLTVGFYSDTEQVPDFVCKIATVWAKGVADMWADEE